MGGSFLPYTLLSPPRPTRGAHRACQDGYSSPPRRSDWWRTRLRGSRDEDSPPPHSRGLRVWELLVMSPPVQRNKTCQTRLDKRLPETVTSRRRFVNALFVNDDAAAVPTVQTTIQTSHVAALASAQQSETGARGHLAAARRPHSGRITAFQSRPRSIRSTCAALRPGAPVTEPPGWVVAPV